MIGKYELNNIYCEDSYDAIKNIPDNSVDCIYIDIPYLYEGGGGGHSKLSKRIIKINKELDDANISSGIEYSLFNDALRVMKKVNMFVWCSKLQILDILNFVTNYSDDNKIIINTEIMFWGKTNPTPSTNNTWLPDVEYCLYFRESGVKLNDGYELKSKFHISPINKNDKDLYNHPTIKPLDLVKRHLLHTTQEGDLVIDFFVGSGTTAVAAKETGRNFIGFEIDKDFHKIAVDRVNGINVHGQTSIFTFID